MRSIRYHGLMRDRLFSTVAFLLAASLLASLSAQVAVAQIPVAQVSAVSGGPSAEPVDAPHLDDGGVTLAEQQSEGLSLLWLIGQGGLLMLPIYLASIVTIAVVIERFISLRRSKVLPSGLLDGLIPSRVDGEMDPRSTYALCQLHPSPAANVIRTMLLKVGRPHSEVERAVADASEREANRMYANVRWLNLIAAVTPLLGLLGTVWGMIHAFFDTTQLTVGQNKADFLASGIYVALVTTLGGLAVAIPAAVFAHYFEGRIERIIHHVEELLFNLLPHVERYEGRLRLNAAGALDAAADGQSADGQSPGETLPKKRTPTPALKPTAAPSPPPQRPSKTR